MQRSSAHEPMYLSGFTLNRQTKGKKPGRTQAPQPWDFITTHDQLFPPVITGHFCIAVPKGAVNAQGREVGEELT